MSYLLIGLGNPGEKYTGTRHNAGKAFVRWMNRNQELGIRNQGNFEAVETECFMNSSGAWIKNRYKNYKDYKNLIIAHDDLDIPLGKFKIQFGKGPRLHNGVLSVEQVLGTKEFWRIRIGVDSRLTGQQVNRLKNTDSGEDYVLSKFSADEKKTLEGVFPEIRDQLKDFKGT